MTAFIPYPAIARHGIIGDRRTAALVAADGSIDWLCVPDYDGRPVFGALLDATRGGVWRLGPATLWNGTQTFPGPGPILQTRWTNELYDLELQDVMAWPGDERPAGSEHDRIVLRRLRCRRGTATCVNVFAPADQFRPIPEGTRSVRGAGRFTLWISHEKVRGTGTFAIGEGDEIWFALAFGADREWSIASAARLWEMTDSFWRGAMARLDGATRHPRLARSAMMIRLLEFAPCGSIVAAPTTSVPERIGGSWNADYRLTWVRDASLCMAALARLGDVESAGRYLAWLADRGNSVRDAPLQVLYSIRGEDRPEQQDLDGVAGYRGSAPVRIGNHAFRQQQLDIYGYLADCALEYVEHGGRWRPEFWDLLCRCADYVVAHWREPGHGIWELEAQKHYVSGRVMCWAALDRIQHIADRIGARPAGAANWRTAAAAIRREIEDQAWSDRLGAFKQATDADALDASALLIPLTGMLPLDDPRVRATVDTIAERLTIHGCVYRFDPQSVELSNPSPMGEFEGAFLPCTFWLATVLALMGRTRDADTILRGVEAVAGPLGVLAEAIDPRGSTFAGNTPLLFSHVEHIRAVQTLEGRPWTSHTEH